MPIAFIIAVLGIVLGTGYYDYQERHPKPIVEYRIPVPCPYGPVEVTHE